MKELEWEIWYRTKLQVDYPRVGKISLPIVINVPIRASLAVETQGLLFLWLAQLNKKSNVSSLYYRKTIIIMMFKVLALRLSTVSQPHRLYTVVICK